MRRVQLTLNAAAAALGMEPSRLRSLAVQGEIPSESRRDTFYFFQEDLELGYARHVIEGDVQKATPQRAPGVHEEGSVMLSEYCPEECIAAALAGNSRAALVKSLIDLADRSGFLYNPPDLEEEIVRREDLGSTNIGMGVAIPHTLTREEGFFSDSFICIARLARPSFFNSAPDGKPTELLILSCALTSDLHLAILSRITALCRETDFIVRVRDAEDAAEIRTALELCETQLDQRRKR